MRTLDRNVGLMAGVAATVTLLACEFVFNVALPLSLIPSLLVGAGVLLVSPGGLMGKRLTPTKQEAAAMKAADEALRRLAERASQIRDINKVPRELCTRILADAARCLQVIETDANKFEASLPFLNRYIEPLEKWMEGYLRVLSRDLDIAKQALKTAEEDTLPRLTRDFATLYEQLHINDVASLQTGSVMELRFPGIELNDEEFSQ